MSDINILINKIIRDAENRRDEIMHEAEKESAKLISKSTAAAELEKRKKIAKAKMEAPVRKERIVSSAAMEVRNRRLEAKQKVIERVFDEAAQSLTALPDREYLNFISKTLVSLDLKGDETLIFAQRDSSRIDDKFIQSINGVLYSKGKTANIKIDKSFGNFMGGFIVQQDGIELNYTFDAVLNSMRDELEQEVADLLFG